MSRRLFSELGEILTQGVAASRECDLSLSGEVAVCLEFLLSFHRGGVDHLRTISSKST